MSGNVEDEARARLDVAQLYEDMGQMPKAIRYYLEAAQIYREGGVPARHRELCNKILRLDPGNVQAQEELNSARAASGLDGPPAPPSGESPPPPAAGTPAVAAPTAPRPSAAGGLPLLQLPQPQPGKVLIPTPWLFRDPRYVQSAKKQLTTPLERSVLQFDPLPKVDPQMVMIKQEQRKKQEEEAARKANPVRESAFAKREGSVFTTNKPAAPAAGTSTAGAAPKPAAPTPQQAPAPGGGRAGNLDLAEAIRRRMQEKGK